MSDVDAVAEACLRQERDGNAPLEPNQWRRAISEIKFMTGCDARTAIAALDRAQRKEPS